MHHGTFFSREQVTNVDFHFPVRALSLEIHVLLCHRIQIRRDSLVFFFFVYSFPSYFYRLTLFNEIGNMTEALLNRTEQAVWTVSEVAVGNTEWHPR